MTKRRLSQDAYQFASGTSIPVWEATVPRSSIPKTPSLETAADASVCVVGSGIAGLTTCYELLRSQKKPVILLEARELLAGESARTTGHLASGDQGERFYNLVKMFGRDEARLAYDGHHFAIQRIGQISKEIAADCEYRRLPAIVFRAPDAQDDIKKEYEAMKDIKIPVQYLDTAAIGDLAEGPALQIGQQAAFHPTKYLAALIKNLLADPNFSAYSNTRYLSHQADGSRIEITAINDNEVQVKVRSDSIVIATNVPPRKVANILKQHYYRTYAIAAVVPKGAYADELLYSNHDLPYIYVRKTSHPSDDKEYLIVGGEDHVVGMKHDSSEYEACYQRLETWMRQHFDKAEAVDYKWSGQTVNSSDGLGFIGQSGLPNEYIITGDNGNGLTHGTLGAAIVADEITGKSNKFASLWRADRKPTKSIGEDIKENLEQQRGYLDYAKTLPHDVEDLPQCTGRIIRGDLSEGAKPIAAYKDAAGKVHRFSAVCPHMKGVVAWNAAEGSFDCPVHGSRFAAATGMCVMGPAKMGLHPQNKDAEDAAKGVANV